MKSADLLAALRSQHPELATALEQLGQDNLEAVLNAPRYYIDHPLKWLLEGIHRPCSLAAQVLANTGWAWGQAAASRVLGTWLRARLREAACVPSTGKHETAYASLAKAYKALSEIRALGYLRSCGLSVTPCSSSGTDFIVRHQTGETVVVEVTTLRMAERSAHELAKAHTPGLPFGSESGAYTNGNPKEGEFAMDNVARRFLQKAVEENDQLPEDRPSLVWVDLQFEDRWSTSCELAWPMWMPAEGRFSSGGIWLAFYGKKGTPLMDFESTCEGLPPEIRGIRHTCLRYDGYFHSGEARASAVVISWPRCTVLFENPHASNPLPLPIIERLLQLRWFDWPRSWIRPFWKDQQTGLAELRQRVCLALDEIAGVAQVARLDW